MSTHYEQVKKYYDNGLWSLAQVKRAVKSGWITEDEYKEITGEKYKV